MIRTGVVVIVIGCLAIAIDRGGRLVAVGVFATGGGRGAEIIQLARPA